MRAGRWQHVGRFPVQLRSQHTRRRRFPVIITTCRVYAAQILPTDQQLRCCPEGGSGPAGIVITATRPPVNRPGFHMSCTRPDLRLTKTCTPVAVGLNTTCTITVTNSGTADATGVKATDTPPADTSVVSATASGGGFACDTSVQCNGGSLAADGGQVTNTVVLTVATCGDKTNTAQVQATPGETNLTNNSATATISVSCNRPAVTLTTSCTPAAVGANTTCTITVTNSGTADATGVVVADAPPAGTSVVSATASGSGFSCDTTVKCSGGSLLLVVVRRPSPSCLPSTAAA